MSRLSRLPAVDFRMIHLLAGGLVIAAVAFFSQTDPQQTAADDAGGKPAVKSPDSTTKAADSKPAKKTDSKEPGDAKAALAEFNSLIGGWRGVAMPKRGSQTGAWSENADWVWNFDKGVATLHYHTEDGKLLESATLGWNAEKKEYRLHAHFADKVERDYAGKLAENKLILDSQPDAAGLVHRITLTRLNPKRTVVLVEKRPKNAGFFTRVAEIGYTRQGTSLAVEGGNEPQCVVTGGKGTMKVSYKGQAYYVCCSGCKQAFEADPEGILAEYKKRLAAKAEKDKTP